MFGCINVRSMTLLPMLCNPGIGRLDMLEISRPFDSMIALPLCRFDAAELRFHPSMFLLPLKPH